MSPQPDPTRFAGRQVCRLSDIPAQGARGFVLHGTEPADELRLIVMTRSGGLHAFINSCPHARAPLDYPPDKFFDYQGRFLLCSLHGARFRPEDGLCVGGPAPGQRLTPVPLVVVDGTVFVAE